MINIFDSLLLLPNICDPTEFLTWLEAMKEFVQQLIYSSTEDVLNQHLLDNLFEGIWITDKNDVIIFVNEAISALIDVPRNRIVGTEIVDSLQINTFQHFIPFYQKAKRNGCPVQYGPIPTRTSTGRLSHQAGWMIPRYSENRFNGVICSVRNVNEEKNLISSEARWQAICDCSLDCIMLTDLQGLILHINRSLPGFQPNDMLDCALGKLLPQADRKEIENCLQRVKETGIVEQYFSEHPAKDGAIAYLETRIGPVVQRGNVLGYIVNVSDVTRQTLLEKEIIKQESNLEETNITLKVLLKRIENERLLFQENLSANILCNIEPYINKLKQTGLDRHQIRAVEVLEQNIKDMASPLVYSAMMMNLRLTPAEMQISNFIRQGYSSKEIAELLNISPATIDKHRKNIRRKLGITNKKQNLRSVLSSISC